jgi:hypothetical protein
LNQKKLSEFPLLSGRAQRRRSEISLWESKEDAETYNRETYAEVTKLLAGVVERTPQIETYEVSNSTFHKIAAAVVA